MPPEEEQSRFQEGTRQFISEHLETIRKKIEESAVELMKDRNISEQMAVAKAIGLFAPGDEFEADPKPPPVRFWSRISESFSGITLVSALLAIIFGVLGFWKSGDPESGQRWLDVAKIFAGAVVGSAGAVAIGTRK